jgi:hypothetical protein
MPANTAPRPAARTTSRRQRCLIEPGPVATTCARTRGRPSSVSRPRPAPAGQHSAAAASTTSAKLSTPHPRCGPRAGPAGVAPPVPSVRPARPEGREPNPHRVPTPPLRKACAPRRIAPRARRRRAGCAMRGAACRPVRDTSSGSSGYAPPTAVIVRQVWTAWRQALRRAVFDSSDRYRQEPHSGEDACRARCVSAPELWPPGSLRKLTPEVVQSRLARFSLASSSRRWRVR